MEKILVEAQGLCHADGGTLYLRADESRLSFAIVRNDSLDLAYGGSSGQPVTFPPLYLYDEDTGERNEKNVATYVALSGATVNVPDAYTAEHYDFSGTKAFDERTGYRSMSFLTIPMKNYSDEVIGVLQLINAKQPDTGEVVPFSLDVQPVIEALASQAAVALDNQMLLESQKTLLESFIKLIAVAIDEKSPYTGGHCQRVPVLTEMLADAACAASDGPFREFDLSDEERYELHIAGWMHDCGKVTTPEYVVDKATKLQTIHDRIETVRMRFEVLKRDAELARLGALMDGAKDLEAVEAAHAEEISRLDEQLAFLERMNIGGEFLEPENIARIRDIARRESRNGEGKLLTLLTDDEVENLCISRGTLLPKERNVINNHIVMTIKMLEQLPFPKHLRRVPEYAGSHHEKMDGTGYPRGLTGDQMSVPARMIAIADIFEALTAPDRPYKKAKKLSESLAIMRHMRRTNHIDTELYRLFLEAGVYKRYAEQFLKPEQVDEIDTRDYLD